MLLVPLPTFFEFCLTLFSFITLTLVTKYVIRPGLSLIYYKKQGAVSFFYPKLSSYSRNFHNLLKTGDFYYSYKEIVKQDPKTRCIAENFGDKTVLFLTEPQITKEFLRRYDIYNKERDSSSATADMLNGSLVYTEGEAWKKHRKVMSEAFSFEFLRGVVPMIKEVIQEQFGAWVKNGDDLQNFDLLHKMGNVTGEVTGRFFFGKRFSEHHIWGLSISNAIQKLVERAGAEQFSWSKLIFGKGCRKRNILPHHRSLNKSIKEFRAKCAEMVHETEKHGKNEKNVLNLLLQYQRTCPPEDRMTDELLCGKMMGIFLGGTETSALLLTSAVYYLYKYPHVLKKLREEVDEKMGDLKDVTLDSLVNLEYMAAYLKECLRFGAAMGTFIPRVATRDDNLCGIQVKKGTLVNAIIPVIQHDERYFPDPEEFKPERWLVESRTVSDNAFIIFSDGPRNCLGEYLGMTDSKMVLATFIKMFDFEFPEGYQMRLVQRLSFPPLEPPVIKLKLRKNVVC